MKFPFINNQISHGNPSKCRLRKHCLFNYKRIKPSLSIKQKVHLHYEISLKSALPQKSRDGSAGADAGSAGVKEIFHFLFAVDAAGSFDFHLFSHVFF